MQSHLSAAGLAPAVAAVSEVAEHATSRGIKIETDRPAGRESAAELMARAVQELAAGVKPADLEELRGEVRGVQKTAADIWDAHYELAEQVEELAKSAGNCRTIRIQVGELPPGPEVENARPEAVEIVKRLQMFRAAGMPANAYMAGPAGSGKSTLGKTVAEAMGLRFDAFSFANDTSSGKLLGFPTVTGEWKESSFVDFYEKGGVFLLDEVDAADPGILVGLNRALDNGELTIPAHHDPARRIIKRHADTVVLAAANTWGLGPDAQYMARLQQDAAWLDRFVGAQFFVGYDVELEKSLCPFNSLRASLQMMRDKINEHKVRRIVSTRAIARAGAMKRAGMKDAEIINAITVAWTAAEKAKVC